MTSTAYFKEHALKNGETPYSMRGVAKAWASVTTNDTIQNSLNVSSVVDVAAGRFELNFTNDMDDSDYAGGAIGSHTSGAGSVGSYITLDRNTPYTDVVKTTGAAFQGVYNASSTPSLGDVGYAGVSIVGDLA
jgi:hypothetical protein